MPIGRIISKDSICDPPKYLTISFTSAIMKFTYLKNPNNPRFPAKLTINNNFLVCLSFALKIAFPK